MLNEDSKFRLYPNPLVGQQQFYIESEKDIQVVSLYDAKGVKVPMQFHFITNNKVTIQPFSQLSTGIYYVLCEGKSLRQMQAVMVK
jgi:hypothetical protein